MSLYQVLHDGQADAEAAAGARAGRLGLPVQLEDPWQQLRCNADARVPDAHYYTAWAQVNPDRDAATRWCVFDRVAEQIAEHLRKAIRIGKHPYRFAFDGERQLVLLRGDGMGVRFDRLTDHHTQIGPAWTDRQKCPAAGTCSIQPVFNEAAHMPQLAFQHGQRRNSCGIFKAGLQKQPYSTGRAGQRRAQFVGKQHGTLRGLTVEKARPIDK